MGVGDACPSREDQPRPRGVGSAMNVLGRLALLFIIVPLLELALLIEVGQIVGFLPTMALVIFTGITGAWLARLEGLRTLWKLREDMARGQLPGQAIMDGMSILMGAAFLLTPGIITDFVGFSLLLPFTRRGIQRLVRQRFEQSIKDGAVQMTVDAGGWGAAPPEAEAKPEPWKNPDNELNPLD
jgi:UPF0716 protein FxsA